MAIETMEDLFMHGLRDIYYAEKKIVDALPKMARAVSSNALREAFNSHLEESKNHVTRLEQVFADRGAQPGGDECPAIEGLIEEAEEIMDEVEEPDVCDAALLAGAQAVEHYEIARYGTLCEWAQLLGFDDSKARLGETLEEEKNADKTLTKIAEDRINERAAA